MVRLQVVGCFHRSTTVVTHPLPPETRMPGVRSPCPRSYQANQRVAPRIAVDIRGRANYAHNPGKYLEIYHSPFGGIGCSIFGSASVQRIPWVQTKRSNTIANRENICSKRSQPNTDTNRPACRLFLLQTRTEREGDTCVCVQRAQR